MTDPFSFQFTYDFGDGNIVMITIPLPGSAIHAFTVTKSDSTVFTQPTRYIYVGGAGDVAVLMSGDVSPNSVIFKAVPVGTVLSLSVQQVLSTGTTATNILGLY